MAQVGVNGNPNQPYFEFKEIGKDAHGNERTVTTRIDANSEMASIFEQAAKSENNNGEIDTAAERAFFNQKLQDYQANLRKAQDGASSLSRAMAGNSAQGTQGRTLDVSDAAAFNEPAQAQTS